MPTKETIIKIRSMTGAGIMDIKEALEEAGDDEEKALGILRKKGQKLASKRAQKEAGEGFIGSYVHSNGKVGAQVKLQCETDFVARNEEFRELAKNLAMHVTAANPAYLKVEDVPEEAVEKEKSVYAEETASQGKPQEVAEKIIQGKLEKFYEEMCLVNQTYIKDDSKKIKDLLDETAAKIGEKIEITDYYRMEI